MILADIPAVAEATFLVVAALFPIVNPLGSAAIYINLVGPLNEQLNRMVSKKIAIYSFFLLFISLFCGVKILSFFGISIYAVQIGGGLIVTATGWVLLNKPSGRAKTEEPEPQDVLKHTFYPYTLPITVGPGAISVAITLGAHLIQSLRARSILSPLVLISATLGIVIVCVIVYICYIYARTAERRLGESGTEVMLRLSSFILLCIGIQIICSGVKAYLPTVMR